MTNTLRIRRAERRLTQYQTARKAGISANRYWRIESDWTEPTAEERSTLASLFGVEESVLFPVGQHEHGGSL